MKNTEPENIEQFFFCQKQLNFFIFSQNQLKNPELWVEKNDFHFLSWKKFLARKLFFGTKLEIFPTWRLLMFYFIKWQKHLNHRLRCWGVTREQQWNLIFVLHARHRSPTTNRSPSIVILFLLHLIVHLFSSNYKFHIIRD